MAEEIFELSKLASLLRSRNPSGPDDLSESEFLALDILSKHQPLTIGEIQRKIGVVPAQMSRIIKSLEHRTGGAYIKCAINPDDRRRVDVTLTREGAESHEAYRGARLESVHGILRSLSPEDRLNFMRILRRIRGSMSESLQGEPGGD